MPEDRNPPGEDDDPLLQQPTVEELLAQIAEEREKGAARDSVIAAERERSARELAARDKEIAELRARARGTFFSTYDAIWEVQNMAVGGLDTFDAIRRTGVPGFYAEIVPTDWESYAVATPVVSSEGSAVANGTGKDIFGMCSPQRAHLISHVPNCSPAYGYVAEAALGVRLDDPNDRLKLIRGLQQRDGTARLAGSGIGNSLHSILPLYSPAGFFDSEPFLLIIPILSLVDVQEWKEDTGYNALVVCGKQNDYMAQDARGCYKTYLQNCVNFCGETDIAQATVLLATFVMALASSLKHHKDLLLHVTNLAEKYRLEQLSERLKSVHGHVKIPSSLNDLKLGTTTRIAKVTFKPGVGAFAHFKIPDPFLLTVKAAVNWSAGNDSKLLPLVDERDSDDESFESGSDASMGNIVAEVNSSRERPSHGGQVYSNSSFMMERFLAEQHRGHTPLTRK
jgi:hypothetical protein